MSREAMQQALDALERYEYAEAREALRAALEPVQPSSPLTDEEIHAIPIDEEFAEETYRAGISISKPLLAFARLVERRVAAPPGYVMVPVEPTEEMVLEGRRALRDNGAEGSDFELQDDSAVCYKAMLSAAKGGE